MKKLIIILFFVPFCLDAQFQGLKIGNFEIPKDKLWHTGVGVVISIVSYPLMYKYTGGDFEVSRNAAWMVPCFAACGKELTWSVLYGMDFSFVDIIATTLPAIILAIIMYRWHRGKIRRKHSKTMEVKWILEDEDFEPWSLDNEFLNMQ